ncbi:MAG TPA: phosphate ABC transporter permease subunit PstC [Thermoanaerobaculia bacterium]|nr:phosphate ABC transporter permease subunit PstC [Thermoanaerobaculia bacterium]HXK66968.1 phosphate ABC transporter permease subunit PstC [Thermoanaerobaculia bacterium]
MQLLSFFSLVLMVTIGIALLVKSLPILKAHNLSDLLLGSSFKPLRGEFGFLPFLVGTLWVTGIAVGIAFPLSLLSALYLSEYAPGSLRNAFRPLIDLLAGIPSVIYGVWGIVVFVPLVRDHLAPAMGRFSSGYSVLTAGIVLAVMILPVVIHVLLEVFSAVPVESREAALSLGATRWQAVKHVVLRRSITGIIAACVLGLTRAFGETMAVLMVAGNVPVIPRSLLDAGYPLPALIANNYGEMMSIPLYDSALMLAALLLFGVILFFSILSRWVLVRIERRTL